MSVKRCVEYVDPFIGTQGSGHALVGPQVPRGMVKLGPDTKTLPNAGYDYLDTEILGFVHLHQEGAGGSGGRGNIMLSPVNGPLLTEEFERASRFSHDNENAFAGYYRVWLERYAVEAELTATAHCGLHRYTFTTGGRNRILIDLGHTLGGKNLCFGVRARLDGADTVLGGAEYASRGGHYPAYFCAKFSRGADAWGVWAGGEVREGVGELDVKADRMSGGVILDFDSADGETVEVRVGISYVSAEQARRNMELETAGLSFDEAVTACRDLWEDYLSRIRVEDRNETEKVKFYSAMYRAANAPVDVNENGVYCTGASGRAETVRSVRGFYSEDWALWDTARTTHALAALVEPERVSDMVETFLEIYRRGGWLPMATSPASGVGEVMIGHNAVPVILDAWNHGYRDFDLALAFEAMKKTALEQNPDRPGLGTTLDYVRDGYYHMDDPRPGAGNFSASRTMEVAWSDWCTARTARLLGRDGDEAFFLKRASNWQNLFDPETRFIRPRNGDGSFFADFNPADSFKNGFCECTSWEYTFFVPHDVQGLINHVGGRAEFVRRLDEFFARGLFNYENETSLQVPFLYCYAGAPAKTQKLVRDCLVNNYWNTPNGLHGEDDSGAMSAWYTLAACGLYPANPSDAIYVLTTPMFRSVAFRTKGGVFRIESRGFNEDNVYIAAARLNGAPLDKVWLSWEEIEAGGMLELEMTADPDNGWGTDPAAAPPSMTAETVRGALCGCETGPDGAGGFVLTGRLRSLGARGSAELRVMDGDVCLGRGFVFCEAGGETAFRIPFRVYGGGIRRLRVAGEALERELVFEQESGPARLPKLEAVSGTSVEKPFVLYGSGETVRAWATVKNVGSITFAGGVALTVDGREAARQTVELRSGEERTVTFPVRVEAKGRHLVSVGGADAAALDVAGRPDKTWTAVKTTPSEICTCGETVYIRAEGDHEKKEFGMLFRTEPVRGDFTAYARVSYEELTCPYAPAMIVAKNTLGADVEGFCADGAMSKRGFHVRAWEGEFLTPYRYAPDCPEVPYYFKMEK
ncbi:MAG: GH92 family glycosyl hydrolase, partial [Oscillospiraceae bacterium]|nr:GH92 family glycosyl hydrolase [Oscillospiraceae bacterium]